MRFKDVNDLKNGSNDSVEPSSVTHRMCACADIQQIRKRFQVSFEFACRLNGRVG